MDSNHWPMDFQSIALPTELYRQKHFKGLEPLTNNLEGYCSIQVELKMQASKNSLMVLGLEPRACGLKVHCSTNWAITSNWKELGIERGTWTLTYYLKRIEPKSTVSANSTTSKICFHFIKLTLVIPGCTCKIQRLTRNF